MDLQRFAAICNIGAFAFAGIFGGVQFYIWYKHGDIGVSRLTIFGVLVAVLFVAGLLQFMARKSDFSASTRSLKTHSSPEPPPLTAAQESGRVFINLSPSDLCAFYRTGTTAQASRLVQPYLEKWLRISGTVSDVGHRDDKESTVSLTKKDFDSPLIMMYFPASWYDRISVMGRNDPIQAIGKLERVDGYSIVLDPCELV